MRQFFSCLFGPSRSDFPVLASDELFVLRMIDSLSIETVDLCPYLRSPMNSCVSSEPNQCVCVYVSTTYLSIYLSIKENLGLFRRVRCSNKVSTGSLRKRSSEELESRNDHHGEIRSSGWDGNKSTTSTCGIENCISQGVCLGRNLKGFFC